MALFLGVDGPHGRRGVTRSDHRPFTQDPVQPFELRIAEPHHDRQRVFLQAFDAARTRNRHDVRCAVEQPGEGDLCRRIAFLACDLGYDLHELEIASKVFAKFGCV